MWLLLGASLNTERRLIPLQRFLLFVLIFLLAVFLFSQGLIVLFLLFALLRFLLLLVLVVGVIARRFLRIGL